MRARPFSLILSVWVAIVVIDGDTVRMGDERIRLRGIDAAEMRAGCDAERRLAILTKRRLTELLTAGPITIQRDGLDRYRRTLATIRIGG